MQGTRACKGRESPQAVACRMLYFRSTRITPSTLDSERVTFSRCLRSAISRTSSTEALPSAERVSIWRMLVLRLAMAETMREPVDWARLRALAILHYKMGHRSESDEALRELIEKHANESACQVAEVYGARGEADAAFQWLDRAYAQRDPGLADVKPSPHLRSLQPGPRWRVFLMRSFGPLASAGRRSNTYATCAHAFSTDRSSSTR